MKSLSAEIAGRPDSYVPLTIADGIRASAKRTPGKVALSEGERQLTYQQLTDRIHRVSGAATNGLGLAPGQHVALMLPNCLEFIEIVCGLALAGVPPAMVNPRFTATELAFIANDSEARVLFVHESVEELAKSAELETVERIVTIGQEYETMLADSKGAGPPVAVEEWDPFCISYTGGTTGLPKGVLLSHRSRSLTFFGMAVEHGCYSPEDRALAIAPLFHGGGFAFAMAPISFGGSCEILPRFEPEKALKLIEELGITNTFMVPTHFHAIFALGDQTLSRHGTRSLTTIVSGAAPLPQATKEGIVERFGEDVLHEVYGSTEAGIVTNLRPPDQLRKRQCVGLPFPYTVVRLLDDHGHEVPAGEIGELYSLSPYTFNGYWSRPLETAEAFRDGWLSVGDLARRDDEGYIYIVDRKKDMVISGGINIYPREIEEVLHTHPAVAEAAVVGVSDAYWGEATKAYVVLRGGDEVGEEDLSLYCAESLARHKLPKSFEFVSRLPRNAAGKVLRRELRALGPRDASTEDPRA